VITRNNRTEGYGEECSRRKVSLNRWRGRRLNLAVDVLAPTKRQKRKEWEYILMTAKGEKSKKKGEAMAGVSVRGNANSPAGQERKGILSRASQRKKQGETPAGGWGLWEDAIKRG